MMKLDLSLYDGLPDSTQLNMVSLAAVFGLNKETVRYHVKRGNIPPPDVENGSYLLDQSTVYNINRKKKNRFKILRRMTNKWKLGTLRKFKKELDNKGEK